MKKRMMVIVLVATLVSTMIGCGKKEKTTSTSSGEGSTFELALVTDVGTIDDKSFNQGAWEGVEKYANKNNKTYKYYQPSEKTTASYIKTIDIAVEGGAKVVVCPGFLFEAAVYESQEKYPEVKFILLDGKPHPEKDTMGEKVKIADNTVAIFYAEEQAGFLAGYAAVKDGDTELGFLGGMAVPAVKRFGYGYLQGADYAAKEMGLSNIDVMYHYTGGFVATPEAKSTVVSWYNSGTQVVFGCGGQVGNSVMRAAEEVNGKVIGVDVDQSNESKTVITSALKELGNSVYDAIEAYYEDKFPGGEEKIFDITVDGIGLPMSTSKFETFTEEDYKAIYDKLVKNEVALIKEVDGKDNEEQLSELDNILTSVTVFYID